MSQIRTRITLLGGAMVIVFGVATAAGTSVPASAATVSGHANVSARAAASTKANVLAPNVIGAFPLQNYASGLAGTFRCMTTGGVHDGNVSIYNCNGSKNQTWGWGSTITGSFKQLVNGDGQCLGVSGGSRSQNARVVGWTCDGTGHPDQYWSVGGCLSFCVFFNYHSGYVLSLLNGSTANNAAVVQASYNSNRNDQFWYF
jgi:hypothetical protein